MSTERRCNETEFGFAWNAAEVVRYAEMEDGTVCIGIETGGKRRVDVYVSPTGRSVRVFAAGKGEMKAVSAGSSLPKESPR